MTAIADQRVGGGIAWGLTELPTLVVLGVLFYQWQKSEARHEQRLNRKADLDEDAERRAYNAYLVSVADRSRSGSQS